MTIEEAPEALGGTATAPYYGGYNAYPPSPYYAYPPSPYGYYPGYGYGYGYAGYYDYGYADEGAGGRQ